METPPLVEEEPPSSQRGSMDGAGRLGGSPQNELDLDQGARGPRGQQPVRLACPECRPDADQLLVRRQAVWAPPARPGPRLRSTEAAGRPVRRSRSWR